MFNPFLRNAGMDSHTRMTSSMAGAVPWAQLTPDQSYFRSQAAGRWQADFDTGAHAPVNSIRIGTDGTVDTVALDADQNSYVDLGGQGARDVAAGRL